MSLDVSFSECRCITAAAKSSFPIAFAVLPFDQRRAMNALYAWMRITDDIADNSGDSGQLERWRVATFDDSSAHAILPAFRHTVKRYRIPHEYFHAVLDGVASDLQPQSFAKFEDLQPYCYRVASVVGLCCLKIWGVNDDRAISPAIDAGIAFQLTNIVRDVAEDHSRGRFYLPTTEAAWPPNEAQLRFQIARASEYYHRSRLLMPLLPRRARMMFRMMHALYEALLDEIEKQPLAVMNRRVRVPRWRKLMVIFRSLTS